MLGYYIDIQCVQLQMPNTYALGLTKNYASFDITAIERKRGRMVCLVHHIISKVKKLFLEFLN